LREYIKLTGMNNTKYIVIDKELEEPAFYTYDANDRRHILLFDSYEAAVGEVSSHIQGVSEAISLGFMNSESEEDESQYEIMPAYVDGDKVVVGAGTNSTLTFLYYDE
jgi:hypothetical protein